jgi:protein tyrosine/serine phosphatase
VATHTRCAFLLLIGTLASAQEPGLRNFHKVNDHLYRGAQPAVWGYKTLASLGVKTVIDLREEGISEVLEEKLVKNNGMKFLSVPLNGHKAPTEDEIDKILTVLDDQSNWPIYIHCRRGADRTGTVIACYRVAHDKWDNQRALEEAKACEMDPAQKLMQQFILQFHLSTPALTK